MRLSGLRQTTYQAKHHVSKGLTRMKSALEREREWHQAKEKARPMRQSGAKKGVKIFNWRVSVVRDVIQFSREGGESKVV
jgi:hypothetical protein